LFGWNLVLVAVGPFQKTESRDAVENPGEFANLRNIRLTEKHRLFRIDSAGQKINRKTFDPLLQILRFRIRGHRVIIGNKQETLPLVPVLKINALLHRSEVVADMRDS